MQIITNGGTRPIPFLLVQSADHITGLTGATPTVTICKNASGSFASPSGSTAELANGWYAFTPSGADTTTNGPLIVHATAGSADPTDITCQVVAVDVYDAVHFGISALPNTAVSTNASLLTSGTGTDQLSVASGRIDLGKILGTAVSTPATAGILDVNVKNINNLVSSGNAAFGPVWDVVRASHTTSGTFGGDTVTPPTNWTNSLISTGGAYAIDWANVANPTSTVALSGTTVATVTTTTTATNLTNAPTNGDLTATMKTSVTTAATAATPTAASVTGAVGSVTGNVGGSVASVVGAVGSVTGNVGGSVASVVGAVGSVTGNVGGSVASVVGAVGSVTGSIGSLGATAKTDVSTAVLTTQMTESYAALHAVPTLAQGILELRAFIVENSVVGTTVTAKKVDGSTTAETATINSSTAPTSITRAS